ncbi:MAG: hypothetical protein E7658_01610 [Ruminococcaceae bacterium]|nr:hypothetical protein [Oscillospiraceae bacterium]
MILDHARTDRHCLTMTTALDYTLNDNGFEVAVLRAEEYLCVIGAYDDPAVGDPGTLLQCIYNDTAYTFETLDDWDTMVCRIPYLPDGPRRMEVKPIIPVNKLALSGSSITGFTLSFADCDTAPVISFAPVLYADCENTVSVVESPLEEGHFGGIYRLALYTRAPGEADFTETVLLSYTKKLQCTYTMADTVGYEWYMVLVYRTFDEAEWGSAYYKYVTTLQITTPVQTVSRSGSVPLAPAYIRTGALLAGSPVTVTWAAVEDPVVPVKDYTLERSADGVNFTALYTGTSLQYPDIVPADGDGVWYRVRANGTNGAVSPWCTSGMLTAAVSNMYIGTVYGIRPVGAVYIGSRRASPLAIVG